MAPDIKEQHEKLLAQRKMELAAKSVGLGASNSSENSGSSLPKVPSSNNLLQASAYGNNPIQQQQYYQQYPGGPLYDQNSMMMMGYPLHVGGHAPIMNFPPANIPTPGPANSSGASIPKDKFSKPKLEAGLLGEVGRMEKEREILKRTGQYRPSMAIGGMPLPAGRVTPAPFSHSALGFSPSPYPVPPLPGWGYASPSPIPTPTPGMYSFPQQHPSAYMMSPVPPPPMSVHGGFQRNPMMMGYAGSDYGGPEGMEDPALAYHHQVMRERWLESERFGCSFRM